MYSELEKNIKYTFKNPDILREALSHSSYVNEKKINQLHSNERLEFLGDAVLELVVSNYLFNKYPELTEGQLSKFRASVVCEDSFANISKRLSLGSFLMLGKGEFQSGGNNRDSILADLFEAVIGAVYLDSDFLTIENIVLNILKDDISRIEKTFEVSDYKTILQEIIQAESKVPLKYEILSEAGPSHEKVFTVNVIHGTTIIGVGVGKTKKEAEQNAAQSYLENKK